MPKQEKSTEKTQKSTNHIIKTDRKGRHRTKEEITEDTPLTPVEQAFITNYLKTGSLGEAMKASDVVKRTSNNAYSRAAFDVIRRPNVQKELHRIMEELRKESIATADEVMQYFTSVMRGEVKDQFGLEAPLSERTKAAQELAKRSIDIDQRIKMKQELAGSQEPIQVNLIWTRNTDS